MRKEDLNYNNKSVTHNLSNLCIFFLYNMVFFIVFFSFSLFFLPNWTYEANVLCFFSFRSSIRQFKVVLFFLLCKQILLFLTPNMAAVQTANI